MAIREDAMACRGSRWKSRLARPLRELGAYSAILLTLPGGSLIALTLWNLRHRMWLVARARRALATILAFGVGLISPR
jgi:hypothetical protein